MEGDEWIVPGDEEVPMPPDDYVVSFVPFHKRRLRSPHRIFWGLLHYYDIDASRRRRRKVRSPHPNGIPQAQAQIPSP
jgi:hypothetical protein